MRLYGGLTNRLADIARMINPNAPTPVPGAELTAVNNMLPGIESVVRIAHTNIENSVDRPTEEQRAFFSAIDNRANAELLAAAPQVITAQDFVNNPHLDATGNPLTYEQMQIDSIDAIRQRLIAEEAEARANMDDTRADQIAQDLLDLDEYSNAFSSATLPRSPRYRRNPLAAQDYAEQILATGPSRPMGGKLYNEMIRQETMDRAFIKFDGQVKDVMLTSLNELDTRALETLRGNVETAQNNIIEGNAENLQNILNPSIPVPGRATYDAVSTRLGAQELRVAQRIGLPDADGKLTRVRSGAEMDAFLATNHLARSTALSAKVSRHLAEHRTWNDHATNFWSGKNAEGGKETSMVKNSIRKIAKIGIFGVGAALAGPAGLVAAAGLYVGARKWSNNMSEHNNELRSRAHDSFGSVEQLVALMSDPRYNTVALKLQQAQRVEREGRSRDEREQTVRRRIDLGKAATQAALVWTSPVWVPWAGGLLGAAAESALVGGGSFVAAHPTSLLVGAVATPITLSVRKANKSGGGHH
jgi:hypothetical protein